MDENESGWRLVMMGEEYDVMVAREATHVGAREVP